MSHTVGGEFGIGADGEGGVEARYHLTVVEGDFLMIERADFITVGINQALQLFFHTVRSRHVKPIATPAAPHIFHSTPERDHHFAKFLVNEVTLHRRYSSPLLSLPHISFVRSTRAKRCPFSIITRVGNGALAMRSVVPDGKSMVSPSTLT